MATILRFEDMEIWKLARRISKEVFEFTQSPGICSDYSLKNQMNSSSGSIMDNIAEGFCRGSRLEFVQFLSISSGSCGELKSQFYRCFDRNYLEDIKLNYFLEMLELEYNKINAFIQYLNKSKISGTKFLGREENKK